jgi:hypothetical protein
MKRRDVILDTIDDLVTDLLWEGRKEDEELPRGAIEEAIAAGEVTEEELVAKFRNVLCEARGTDDDEEERERLATEPSDWDLLGEDEQIHPGRYYDTEAHESGSKLTERQRASLLAEKRQREGR